MATVELSVRQALQRIQCYADGPSLNWNQTNLEVQETLLVLATHVIEQANGSETSTTEEENVVAQLQFLLHLPDVQWHNRLLSWCLHVFLQVMKKWPAAASTTSLTLLQSVQRLKFSCRHICTLFLECVSTCLTHEPISFESPSSSSFSSWSSFVSLPPLSLVHVIQQTNPSSSSAAPPPLAKACKDKNAADMSFLLPLVLLTDEDERSLSLLLFILGVPLTSTALLFSTATAQSQAAAAAAANIEDGWREREILLLLLASSFPSAFTPLLLALSPYVHASSTRQSPQTAGPGPYFLLVPLVTHLIDLFPQTAQAPLCTWAKCYVEQALASPASSSSASSSSASSSSASSLTAAVTSRCLLRHLLLLLLSLPSLRQERGGTAVAGGGSLTCFWSFILSICQGPVFAALLLAEHSSAFSSPAFAVLHPPSPLSWLAALAFLLVAESFFLSFHTLSLLRIVSRLSISSSSASSVASGPSSSQFAAVCCSTARALHKQLQYLLLKPVLVFAFTRCGSAQAPCRVGERFLQRETACVEFLRALFVEEGTGRQGLGLEEVDELLAMRPGFLVHSLRHLPLLTNWLVAELTPDRRSTPEDTANEETNRQALSSQMNTVLCLLLHQTEVGKSPLLGGGAGRRVDHFSDLLEPRRSLSPVHDKLALLPALVEGKDYLDGTGQTRDNKTTASGSSNSSGLHAAPADSSTRGLSWQDRQDRLHCCAEGWWNRVHQSLLVGNTRKTRGSADTGAQAQTAAAEEEKEEDEYAPAHVLCLLLETTTFSAAREDSSSEEDETAPSSRALAVYLRMVAALSLVDASVHFRAVLLALQRARRREMETKNGAQDGHGAGEDSMRLTYRLVRNLYALVHPFATLYDTTSPVLPVLGTPLWSSHIAAATRCALTKQGLTLLWGIKSSCLRTSFSSCDKTTTSLSIPAVQAFWLLKYVLHCTNGEYSAHGGSALGDMCGMEEEVLLQCVLKKVDTLILLPSPSPPALASDRSINEILSLVAQLACRSSLAFQLCARHLLRLVLASPLGGTNNEGRGLALLHSLLLSPASSVALSSSSAVSFAASFPASAPMLARQVLLAVELDAWLGKELVSPQLQARGGEVENTNAWNNNDASGSVDLPTPPPPFLPSSYVAHTQSLFPLETSLSAFASSPLSFATVLGAPPPAKHLLQQPQHQFQQFHRQQYVKQQTGGSDPLDPHIIIICVMERYPLLLPLLYSLLSACSLPSAAASSSVTQKNNSKKRKRGSEEDENNEVSRCECDEKNKTVAKQSPGTSNHAASKSSQGSLQAGALAACERTAVHALLRAHHLHVLSLALAGLSAYFNRVACHGGGGGKVVLARRTELAVQVCTLVLDLGRSQHQPLPAFLLAMNPILSVLMASPLHAYLLTSLIRHAMMATSFTTASSFSSSSLSPSSAVSPAVGPTTVQECTLTHRNCQSRPHLCVMLPSHVPSDLQLREAQGSWSPYSPALHVALRRLPALANSPGVASAEKKRDTSVAADASNDAEYSHQQQQSILSVSIPSSTAVASRGQAAYTSQQQQQQQQRLQQHQQAVHIARHMLLQYIEEPDVLAVLQHPAFCPPAS